MTYVECSRHKDERFGTAPAEEQHSRWSCHCSFSKLVSQSGQVANEGLDFGPDNGIGLFTCSEVVVVRKGNVSKWK